MTAGQIAAELGNHSAKAGGGYMGCCPAHNDKNPSLAIDEDNDSLLIKCFAGCSQEFLDGVKDALRRWAEKNGGVL